MVCANAPCSASATAVLFNTKDIIEDYDSQNSQKWMELLLADLNGNEAAWVSNALIDLREWIQICEKNGFSENIYKKMYGELPAPIRTASRLRTKSRSGWRHMYLFPESRKKL